MSEIAVETPDTVEFGGLLWKLNHVAYGSGIEYRTYLPGIGDCRVYRYPPGDDHCAGEWLWSAELRGLIYPLPRLSHLDMECSAIVPTMEEAMQGCLDAKGKYIEQVLMLAQLFGVKNRGDYEAGYFEGVKIGKENAIKAIREAR